MILSLLWMIQAGEDEHPAKRQRRDSEISLLQDLSKALQEDQSEVSIVNPLNIKIGLQQEVLDKKHKPLVIYSLDAVVLLSQLVRDGKLVVDCDERDRNITALNEILKRLTGESIYEEEPEETEEEIMARIIRTKELLAKDKASITFAKNAAPMEQPK